MMQYVSSDDNKMYNIHKPKKRPDVMTRALWGPPSSPPIDGMRLSIISAMANRANEQKITVEKPKLPASTTNLVLFFQWYMAAAVHARPMPRNTLTAFEPVTFPTELSAYLSCIAATLLANVSTTNWILIKKKIKKTLFEVPHVDWLKI